MTTFAETQVLNLCKWLGAHKEPHCMGCISIRNFQMEERERAARIAENKDNWAYPEGRAEITAKEIARKIRKP